MAAAATTTTTIRINPVTDSAHLRCRHRRLRRRRRCRRRCRRRRRRRRLRRCRRRRRGPHKIPPGAAPETPKGARFQLSAALQWPARGVRNPQEAALSNTCWPNCDRACFLAPFGRLRVPPLQGSSWGHLGPDGDPSGARGGPRLTRGAKAVGNARRYDNSACECDQEWRASGNPIVWGLQNL